MTIVFMSLHVAGRRNPGRTHQPETRLPILLALGIGSAFQWYHSEELGAGDLRWYAAVQVYALTILLVALLLPPRYSRTSDLATVAAFYVLARILELGDRPVFSIGHFMSGHTLKRRRRCRILDPSLAPPSVTTPLRPLPFVSVPTM